MSTHTIQFDRPLADAAIIAAPTDGTGSPEAIHVEASSGVAVQESNSRNAEIRQLLTRMLAEVNKLKDHHTENLKQIKTMSVQLAMVVVKKMIGESAAIQTLRLEMLLEEALNRGEPAISVRLHSQDVCKIDSFAGQVSSELQQVNIVADDSINAGECRVQYAAYQLTSDLVRQIEETEHCLLEVVDEL